MSLRSRQLQPRSGEPPVGTTGRQIDTIVLQIDYNIIRHFSEHLYGSPNKAIEELASNGFDALARSVYVYIPGQYVSECVVVWDDGTSMDAADLHKLWWIAQSPKVGDRLAIGPDGKRRAMIGKFGIGKLASYAVGHRITHLCRIHGRFLLVRVDYRDVPHLKEGEAPKRYETPIMELSEAEARMYASGQFVTPPSALKKLWARDCWTLAIIDELRTDIRLTEGRLSWVIGNGLPLRPDFAVWVNDMPVESKIGKDALTSWNLSSPELQKGLASAWTAARKQGRVEGRLEFVQASKTPAKRPAVRLPNLGLVYADVHIFDRSLRDRDPTRPRSYGFFVMVRGRLINPVDAQLFLPVADPSFGTFYRTQYVIDVDGLDPDLLANREQLRQETPRVHELAILQGALYLTSRQEVERADERADKQRRPDSLLPVDSREYYREPMSALLMQAGLTSPKPVDLTRAARIDSDQLGLDEAIAKVRDDSSFVVNTSHPLVKVVQDRVSGTGRAAREAMRVLQMFAVSERLFEGFLHDAGLQEHQVDRIMSWRDGLLRAIALRYATAPAEEVIAEAIEASYQGDRAFEAALANLFSRMGFTATRDGRSGHKDVLVVAPVGKAEYLFTVEAKGSSGSVANDQAEVAAAASHCTKAGARFAVIVARDFAGFTATRVKTPAIIEECREAGNVTIATLDVLIELLEAMLTYYYPLEVTLPVLEPIESPDEKRQRVRSLQSPTVGFDFPGVLRAIWELQQSTARGDLVAERELWHARQDRWGCSVLKDFHHKLVALQALSGELLVVSDREHAVALRQSPEIVSEQIQTAVAMRTA